MSNCELDMDAFLAKIVPPEECSIQKMNEFATATNSHVKALTEVQFSSQLVGNYLRKIPQSIATTVKHYLGFKQTPDEDFWAHTVGKCFFQCHGIDHTSGLLHRPNIPYPIVNGSIIVGGKRGAIPVEFTPLYHGTPVSHDDIDAVYVEPKGFKAIIEKSTVSLTPSTNPLQGSTVTVKVIDDVQPLTCNEISGISSAAIAEMLGGMSNVAYDLLNFPEHQYFTNGVKKFNDGGTTDCTGTLALIRRSVTKIIACLACNDAITSPTITDANASCYGTLAGLFGTQKSSSEIDRVSNEDYNKFRQVFQREKWDELIAALKEKDLQGQPLAHRMKLKVLPNPLIGVKGNYEVDIIFVFSGESKEFENKLPDDTKEKLKKDRASQHGKLVDSGFAEGNLEHYPYIPVSEHVYPPILVGLLSQLASYTLMSQKDAILSYFDEEK